METQSPVDPRCLPQNEGSARAHNPGAEPEPRPARPDTHRREASRRPSASRLFLSSLACLCLSFGSAPNVSLADTQAASSTALVSSSHDVAGPETQSPSGTHLTQRHPEALSPLQHAVATATPSVPSPFAWTADQTLPFPSDLYTVRDETSLTGKRVQLPPQVGALKLLKEIPFDAQTVLNRAETMDGFSSGMPMVVSVPARLSAKGLPDQYAAVEPNAPIQIFDVDTRRRVAFRLRVIEREDSSSPCSLLVIQPSERLQNRHHYLVVLTSALTDIHGNRIPPPPGFVEALRNPTPLPASVGSNPHYGAELSGLLQTQGFDPARLALAFHFTVQSRESFYQPMMQKVAQIHDKAVTEGYELTHLHMRKRPFKGTDKAAYRGRGTFEVLSFTDENGRERQEATRMSLEFLLEMPEECPTGGCPVAIFGHGLGATKETMFQVADAFAQQGIATIGVAAPWHNDFVQTRRVLWGTHDNLDLIHATFMEHSLRNVQLVELIKDDLARRDMLPGTSRLPRHADGHRLRSDRILYIGQSMGGICGVATAALAPDIRAAVFDVAGGSTIDMLFESWIARTMRIPILQFGNLSAFESNQAMVLGIYLFNDIDPLGFAPYLTREILPGQAPRLISQQAGVGDGLVPNWTTDKLARAMALPVLRPAAFARVKATEPDGPGLRYFQHSRNFFLAHLELMFPKSSATAARFFAWSLDRLDENTVPTPPASIAIGPQTLE